MSQNFATGKLKTPIEIKHHNGSVTFCFIFPDNPDNLHQYVISCTEFLPIMLLSGEIVYIAKSDIKAFRSFDPKAQENGYIWSYDPYTVLGVSVDISLEELHERYIILLKQMHPDIVSDKGLHPVFKDLATDITRRLISAYEFIRAEKLSGDNYD